MKRTFAIALAATALLGLLAGDSRAAGKPLKVFVLCGQSNMQGHAHVSTLDVMALDPQTAPLLKEIRGSDGEPRVCEHVWISSLGSSAEEKTGRLTVGYGAGQRGPKIGPELTFGIYMHKQLDEPVLIIKTAWGGKSLHTDFRPPGAGPYEFNAAQREQFQKQGKDVEEMRAAKAEATGRYYRLTVDHVKKVLADVKQVYPDYDPQQGFELAGFVWFQGWNDMVDRGTYPDRGKPGGYDQYSKLLAQFIRDIRKDLSAPELPFVIGVIGVGGPVSEYTQRQQRYKGVHQNFRQAMAAPAKLPEFQDNVAAVFTEKYWDMELKGLREKDAELREQAKQLKERQQLDRRQEQAALDKLRAEAFTSDELQLLEKGASNAEYHYLGAAKIMTRIGKAFAEAMGQLLEG